MAKVLVSLDDALLRSVDRAARAKGVSRSAYLADLAQNDIVRTKGPGTTRRAKAALVQLDELLARAHADDSTDALRAERDAR